MPQYLVAVVERLKMARIENKDAVDLLDQFSDRPATLIYLDPPYLGKRVKGYDHDANSEEFHESLLKAAKKAKCMIFISGYESDLYSDLLRKRDGWGKETLEAVTKGNNGKCFARSEVIWFNQVYLEAKKTGRIQIALKRKEQKNRKVNPVR
jgi:DNA adenine methylase